MRRNPQYSSWRDVSTAVSLHVSHPLSLTTRRRLSVISHRQLWLPSPSPLASTFPSTAAKFPRPQTAWPLAAYPVRRGGHSSWRGKRTMGDDYCSTTPRSPQKSAAGPRSPLKNSVASVEGSLSPPFPSPAPPEICPATSVTVSSVISTRKISGGWSVHDSILAAVGGRASVCLVRSTFINLSPVLVHSSGGWSMPHVSCSVIHHTAIRSFPQSIMIWNVLALCSSESSLRAAVRYCAHVHRVYSTNTLWLPASQAYSCFSILHHIACDAVTCRYRCRITIWKTMNRY